MLYLESKTTGATKTESVKEIGLRQNIRAEYWCKNDILNMSVKYLSNKSTNSAQIILSEKIINKNTTIYSIKAKKLIEIYELPEQGNTLQKEKWTRNIYQIDLIHAFTFRVGNSEFVHVNIQFVAFKANY